MGVARASTRIPVEFRTKDLKGSGRISNLGEGGLFVGTTSIPEEGEIVQLAFLSPRGPSLKLSGLVWWTTATRPAHGGRAPGFGVRLLVESREYESLVQSLLP